MKKKYKTVARRPEGHFSYPVGWPSAVRLGYEGEWVETAPRESTERFVGVGNPFSIRRPDPGARVVDVGCGCGFDTYVASLLVGASGRAVGIDLTAEMLIPARTALAGWRHNNVEFREGSVEALSFEDEPFDLAISNGMLNLVPDKDLAYREPCRVLVRGGSLAIADLLALRHPRRGPRRRLPALLREVAPGGAPRRREVPRLRHPRPRLRACPL